MTTNDRTQVAAVLGLLAALLTALHALSQGGEAVPAAQAAGLAYAVTVALLVPVLRVSVLPVVVLSAKVTGLTAVASVVVACSGTYAGYQLLRNRQPAVMA